MRRMTWYEWLHSLWLMLISKTEFIMCFELFFFLSIPQRHSDRFVHLELASLLDLVMQDWVSAWTARCECCFINMTFYTPNLFSISIENNISATISKYTNFGNFYNSYLFIPILNSSLNMSYVRNLTFFFFN